MFRNVASASPSFIPEGADLFEGIPHPSSDRFHRLCAFCERHPVAVNAALPWLAAEIGHNDGYATMLRFMQHWSGGRLSMPGDPALLAQRSGFEIGPATHRRLLREVGRGAQVEVPSAWGVILALRRVAVAAAVEARLPPDEIARHFGITTRSLR